MNPSLPSSDRLTIRVIEEVDDHGKDYWQFTPSAETTIKIGRASSSDVQLRHASVSKLHANLQHHGDSWVCNAVGRNGVFHQEKEIQEIKIKDGTVLQFAANGPKLHFQLVALSELVSKDEHQEAVEWIEDLAKGDANAATTLWEEYYERVVKLAKKRLDPRQRRISDEEDVAVSVMKSICAGMEAGKFPDLKDSDSLWRLLCVMTKRKVIRHAKHELRLKRGGGQVRGESVFGGAGGDSNAFGLAAFGDDGEFGQQLLEQTEWVFEALGDDQLRCITEMKLAGHTNEEIAIEMNCNVRTIKRRLQTIRSILADAMSTLD